MTRFCRSCLGQVSADADYHPRCLRALFASTKVPVLEVELSKLHLAALEMVGHVSLSGIQRKLALSRGAGRARLQVAAEGSRYLLKPQTETYPSLPENEHVTTRLARLVGIDVSPNALLLLKDGSPAYIVKRFDRTPDGRKLRQEDFCQLAEKSPKEKYAGSGELCVKLLRKYATQAPLEILKLYRMLLFAWWSGNGDLHLKNLSLSVAADGLVRLTPAYDLLCTRLVIPNDVLALPILGKKDRLRRPDWFEFAAYCQLPPKAAGRVLDKQTAVTVEARRLVDRSFLPADQKATYKALLEERTARLGK